MSNFQPLEVVDRSSKTLLFMVKSFVGRFNFILSMFWVSVLVKIQDEHYGGPTLTVGSNSLSPEKKERGNFFKKCAVVQIL